MSAGSPGARPGGSPRPDLVVVGGGVAGCSVARVAARGGARVLVLDDRTLPGAATEAAGGMLSPLGEASDPGPFLSLGIRSLRMYPELIDSLAEETGLEVELRREGKVLLAHGPADEEGLRERMRWQEAAGHDVRWLSPEEVWEIEPAVSSEIRGGLHLPSEGSVDNRRLLRALRASVDRSGGRVRAGVRVTELLVEGRSVRGVRSATGERVEAGRVLVAAGAWSGEIGGLPRPLPIRPVRGQMVALDAPGILRRTVGTEGGYLVPRGPVTSLPGVWVGSTQEDAGFRAETTDAGVARLLEAAVRAVPALGEAPVSSTWAGLRPGTPDGLPVLGADPEVGGLLYATGHFRNGILLAPVTGEAVGALCLGRDPAVDLAPFSPGRFRS